MSKFVHGDFVRPKPSGNLHIADRVVALGRDVDRVHAACGKHWVSLALMPADDHEPRQCQPCWDAFGGEA